MSLTKKDVDKYFDELLSKFGDDDQRYSCYLDIAQQYFNVGEPLYALSFVTPYLMRNIDSPAAHKLFAQCLEGAGEMIDALNEYKASLKLDPKQRDLYFKVCELSADSEVVDKDEAKYWYDKAEAQSPYHPAVQKLKKRTCHIEDSRNEMSLESLLLNKLKETPNDPNLSAVLLNLYTNSGRFSEALNHVIKNYFARDLFWHQNCAHLCKCSWYLFQTSLDEEFIGNYLLALERSLALSVQNLKVTEGIELLARFDEALTEATKKNKSDSLLLILNHMQGQLYFYTALILYLKASQENYDLMAMMELALPLLWLCSATCFDIREAKEEGPLGQILKICILNNVYRIDQGAYLMNALIEIDEGYTEQMFFSDCEHFNRWRTNICQIIHGTLNYDSFSETSFFMGLEGFLDCPVESEDVTNNIDRFLAVSETLYPSSLHHLVWIGVQYLNASHQKSICDLVLPLKFTIKGIGSLQFAPTTSSSDAETLSIIDVEAFLFACVYCAKSSLDHQINKNEPLSSYILPADVSRKLSSREQDLWWKYFNQVMDHTINEDHFSQASAIIQQGIENIRLVDDHVLPLHLLVLLGRTFAKKARAESDRYRATALKSRSLLYWKAAIPQLEKAVHNESQSMFEYQENTISAADAATLIAEGKLFMEMVSSKEDCWDVRVLKESLEEPSPSPSTSAQSNTEDDHCRLLETISKQVTEMMCKLETLSSNQESLRSTQNRLLETVSVLSNKVHLMSIVPNDHSSDALSVCKPPIYPFQVTTSNMSSKPAPSIPAQPPAPTSSNLIPSDVKTKFPILFEPLKVAPLPAPTEPNNHTPTLTH